MFVSKNLPTEIAFPEGYKNLELSHVEYVALLMLRAFQSTSATAEPGELSASSVKSMGFKESLEDKQLLVEYVLIGATPN